MAIRLSTGLRNAILGRRAAVKNIVQGAATMTIVLGSGSNDTITDSGNGFGGFSPHDNLTIGGTLTTAANKGTYEILSVADGVLGFAEGSFNTGEVLLASTVLASSRGGSISDLFRNGYLQCYTGTQPANPDSAATGTLVATYTLNHGAFTAGTDTNGINFDEVSGGTLSKDASETWQTESNGGIVGWFRFMSNSSTPAGTDPGQVRFDGSVATSNADLNMSPTTQVASTIYTIDTWIIPMAAF